MSNFTLDENTSKYQVRAYQPGSIKINDQIYTQSVIVTPTQLIEDWPPQSFTELSTQTLAIIRSIKPDILLLGTGSELQFPEIEVYGELLNHGIGVEIMSTSAACRTFNALSSENRNVAAALLIK